MLGGWLNRTVLEINVLHDRNQPFVRLSDGSIRNGYTVKLLNKLDEPRVLSLAVGGLPGAGIAIVGINGGETARVTVATDNLRELRVYVTLSAAEVTKQRSGSVAFSLILRDASSKLETLRATSFQLPSPEGKSP
jgi:polyferredoxin